LVELYLKKIAAYDKKGPHAITNRLGRRAPPVTTPRLS
jgi:hypothetical protein